MSAAAANGADVEEGALSVSDPEETTEAEGRDPEAAHPEVADEHPEAADEQPEGADEQPEEASGEVSAEDAANAADEEAGAREAALEDAAAAAEREAEEAEASSGPGPGDALDDEELLQAVAALVYASPDPLGTGRLVKLLERPRTARVKAALQALGERLDAAGLPMELRQLAGGWQVVTRASMGDVVARLFQEQKTERISAAALETLAIVTYRQPVTKAEIEAIRGVQAGPILRGLVDRGLVRVTGRADQPGHPLQYGTTRAFLDRFGLGSLEELPRDGELAGD